MQAGEPKNKTFFSKICNIEREYKVVEVVLKALAFIVYCFTVILPIHDLYVTLKHRISLWRVESKKECFRKKIEDIKNSKAKQIEKAYKLIKTAEDQAKAGFTDHAKVTFKEANKTAKEANKTASKANKTASKAKETAATITSPHFIAEALFDIAGADENTILYLLANSQLENRFFEEARETALTITNLRRKLLLKKIAIRQAETGSIKEARATLDELTPDIFDDDKEVFDYTDTSSRIYIAYAHYQVQDGDIEGAKNTAKNIKDHLYPYAKEIIYNRIKTTLKRREITKS